MIRLKDVSVAFDGQAVLQDFNLDLPVGQLTALMGSSGCGKTTVGRICLGLLKPDAGSVTGLEGLRLSAVFQEDRLVSGWPALANLRLVTDERYSQQELEGFCAQLGLNGEDLSKPVSLLSGGQKRRVAILRALLAEFDFICLDEPFKELDVDTRWGAIAWVKAHLAGKTALFITHDPEEAEALADFRVSMG